MMKDLKLNVSLMHIMYKKTLAVGPKFSNLFGSCSKNIFSIYFFRKFSAMAAKIFHIELIHI